MEHDAAIDVALEWSRVCLVDATGQIVRAGKVRSERQALRLWAVVAFFQARGRAFTRIGLEAGPLAQWRHAGLVEAGLPAILIETRHVKAALKAMTVKTDTVLGKETRHEALAGHRPWSRCSSCPWPGA